MDFMKGCDYTAKISRARFENLCDTLFKSTLKSVDKALRDAQLSKSQIDEVVLVGGTTRIPKVQQLLSLATSMVKNYANQLIQMKQSHMELLFKLQS